MQKLYSEWIVKDHRDLVAVLEDLPSVKPPLDLLLELLPRLQCRYYSISSSPKVGKWEGLLSDGSGRGSWVKGVGGAAE